MHQHILGSPFLLKGKWKIALAHREGLCGLQVWRTLHFALPAWDLEKQSSSGGITLTPLHAPNTLVQCLLHSAPFICQIRAWSTP